MGNNKDCKIIKVLDIIKIAYHIFILVSLPFSGMKLEYGYIVLLVWIIYVIVNILLIRKLKDEKEKSTYINSMWVYTFGTVMFFAGLSIVQYNN